jgi:hypothetical protein
LPSSSLLVSFEKNTDDEPKLDDMTMLIRCVASFFWFEIASRVCHVVKRSTCILFRT